MATMNESFFAALLSEKAAKWSAGVAFDRSNALPLDQWSVFENLASAESYLARANAYPGQVVAYADTDGSMVVCVLEQTAEGTALQLKEVGTVPVGDDKSIDVIDEVLSLHNYGKVFYKYIPETKDDEGNVTKEAYYQKTTVDADNLWAAGLEPKVVTEDGKLVIGWYEPNPTTIEGVNDQVTAVQSTVADLETSVGVPSADGQEATGLYKEVEDVQADVENLSSEVGTSADTLGGDVNTLWANVNSQDERITELEGIDHSVYAKTADVNNTLASYATVAYVDGEIDKVEEALANITHFTTEIVDSVDKVNTEGVLYLIKDTTATGVDKYNEYLYIGDEAVLIGDTTTDLSNYNTKEEVANLIATAKSETLAAAGQDAQTKADAAEEAAVKAAAEAADTKYATIETVNGINTRVEALEAIDHDVYAKAADVYTKSETDNAITEAVKGATGGTDASSVLADLNAFKKAVKTEVWGSEVADDSLTGTDSCIDTISTKLDTVAQGAQVNVIETVKVNDTALTVTDKAVNIDLTDYVKSASLAETNSKVSANATAIEALRTDLTSEQGKITNLQTTVGEHTTAITALQNADTQHAAEYTALQQIVSGHTTTLAGKAETSTVEALASRVGANEQDIKTLKETTVPAAITDAVGQAKTYTDAQIKTVTDSIGTVPEDQTIMDIISNIQENAYDDTELRGLISANSDAISAEQERAEAAEKANSDAIAELIDQIDNVSNIMNFRGVIDKDAEGFNTDDPFASIIDPQDGDVVILGEQEYVYSNGTWVLFGDATGNAAAITALTERVAANETAVQTTLPGAIADALQDAKDYTDEQIAAINVGVTSVVSGHEALVVTTVDGVATLNFAEELILNGGTAV